MQKSLAVFPQFKDMTAIDPFTFKHTAGIMQAVTEHVDMGVPPGNHLSIEPDNTVTIVERYDVHTGQAPAALPVMI